MYGGLDRAQCQGLALHMVAHTVLDLIQQFQLMSYQPVRNSNNKGSLPYSPAWSAIQAVSLPSFIDFKINK